MTRLASGVLQTRNRNAERPVASCACSATSCSQAAPRPGIKTFVLRSKVALISSQANKTEISRNAIMRVPSSLTLDITASSDLAGGCNVSTCCAVSMCYHTC